MFYFCFTFLYVKTGRQITRLVRKTSALVPHTDYEPLVFNAEIKRLIFSKHAVAVSICVKWKINGLLFGYRTPSVLY